MKNERLRAAAQKQGVRLWEIAERFGVSDAVFSRKLRREFDAEQMEQALRYVDEIADAHENEGC